mmetsp:Transcript_12169/g.14305  ORF Transcript_12169/g.14305 Transcript_12169/m.14305 type:complete len:117 (-) Transcript_12169:131-481(-)
MHLFIVIRYCVFVFNTKLVIFISIKPQMFELFLFYQPTYQIIGSAAMMKEFGIEMRVTSENSTTLLSSMRMNTMILGVCCLRSKPNDIEKSSNIHYGNRYTIFQVVKWQDINRINR